MILGKHLTCSNTCTSTCIHTLLGLSSLLLSAMFIQTVCWRLCTKSGNHTGVAEGIDYNTANCWANTGWRAARFHITAHHSFVMPARPSPNDFSTLGPNECAWLCEYNAPISGEVLTLGLWGKRIWYDVPRKDIQSSDNRLHCFLCFSLSFSLPLSLLLVISRWAESLHRLFTGLDGQVSGNNHRWQVQKEFNQDSLYLFI